ncbi:MAG: hypothetical protein IH965_05510 [Gemmatimonadetes bacterium]|nr:hypothetical protein [Gemmatimonadota bacterium]
MRIPRLLTATAAICVLIGAGISCGDSTEPPVAGAVTVSLVTPNTDDGAVAVTITGPGLNALVSVTTSYEVFWRLVSETEVRALVFGNLTAGPLVTVNVSDLNQLASIAGAVTEVAQRNDELRSDLSGYAITVAGPSQ